MNFLDKHINTILIVGAVIAVVYLFKSELDKSHVQVGFN